MFRKHYLAHRWHKHQLQLSSGRNIVHSVAVSSGGILASDRWKPKHLWTAVWFILDGTSILLLMFNHGAVKKQNKTRAPLTFSGLCSWFVRVEGLKPMRKIHSPLLPDASSTPLVMWTNMLLPPRACAHRPPWFSMNTHIYSHKKASTHIHTISMNEGTHKHAHTPLGTHTHTHTHTQTFSHTHIHPLTSLWSHTAGLP